MIAVPKTTYASQVGSLLPNPDKVGDRAEWHGCRETFHSAIMKIKNKRFFFHTNNKENVIGFMEEVQKRMGLKSDQRIAISHTDQNLVICIDPGSWWCSQPVRLSFLTALLRCGLAFDGSNFQEALYSKNYTKDTKTAVDRFIGGYNSYVGSGQQWHATFAGCGAKIDYAERMLLKEEDTKVSEDSMAEAKHIVSIAKENNDVLTFMLARSLDKFYKLGRRRKTISKTKVVGE